MTDPDTLDAVAGRAELKGDSAAVLDAVTLQKMLRADEVVFAYHALPDRLVAWVLSNQGVREVTFATPLPTVDLIRLVDAYRDALIKLNPNASVICEQSADRCWHRWASRPANSW